MEILDIIFFGIIILINFAFVVFSIKDNTKRIKKIEKKNTEFSKELLKLVLANAFLTERVNELEQTNDDET